jgi:DtxR family Mn-dependent transcriptional regulator
LFLALPKNNFMYLTSESEENYLKAIYHLSGKEEKPIATNSLAERLNMRAPSVTDMIKKLSEKGLTEYKKYYGVKLTNAGKEKALKVIRKHRLWEYFLVEKLGFSWSEVHEIAEQLEHINSIELIDRLDDFLDNPAFDPHGDPIPDKNGVMQAKKSILLSKLKENDSAVVTGVNNSSSEFLEYLDNLGVGIGTKLLLKKVFEYDNSMELLLDKSNKHIVISGKTAASIFVNKN